MRQLFLSGGGKASDSIALDRAFVESLRARRILYLPIGLQRTMAGYDGCYEWLESTLRPLSPKRLDIDMWVNLPRLTARGLDDYEAVYIGGGRDTHSLIRLFQQSGFFHALRVFGKSGGIIYGGSAGAMIMGSRVFTIQNSRINKRIEIGLDLVTPFTILGHTNLFEEPTIQDLADRVNTPIIGLPETTGMHLLNGQVRVYGKGHIAVYRPHHSVIRCISGSKILLREMLV